jgi:predicted nucleic acid-binding protein
MNIFIDSSFIIALVFKGDTNHQNAKVIFKKYIDSEFFIDDVVKYESINVALKKTDIKTVKFLYSWLENNGLNTISLNSEIWQLAYTKIINKYTKSGPNVFDYIHFSSLDQYHLKNVLTFDRHFTSAGFNILK